MMGMCSVEAIWMVLKSQHKTNIMINPHKNNAVFQQQIAYSREDIWMNLWGSFRDSSEAHDCIFIQTFCFSLIIICRLEMAMIPRSYKVVCTFPEFFIQHCQLFSSKAVAGIIYQGTNLWSHWSIFQKEIFHIRKTGERDIWGFQNRSMAGAEYQLPCGGGLVIIPKQHFNTEELSDKTSYQSAHFLIYWTQ